MRWRIVQVAPAEWRVESADASQCHFAQTPEDAAKLWLALMEVV